MEYESLAAEDTVKDTIAIHGLRIQKESRRVFINDNEATLSNKEFDLLMFLAQNPNRVGLEFNHFILLPLCLLFFR